MPAFAPPYLASWTGGQWTVVPQEVLHGFTQDTRQLKPGQVFVALKTDKRDGWDFLPAAAAAGASAAIVDRKNPLNPLPQLVVANPLEAFQTIAREHRRAFRGPVIGVTGSCGKTSTKNLLAALLGDSSTVLATEGNLNNALGVPLTLTRIDSGVYDSAVIEAGIGAPGEMEILGRMIEPDYGIVTLVAPAHTAELGGIEGVAREKAKLLEYIRPAGLGVFPKQCWDFPAFQDLPQTSIVLVPEGNAISAPRVVPFAVNFTATRTSVVLNGRRCFEFRRVTRGMAQNAALAIVLASEIGATDEAMQRSLEQWQPAKWRGEVVQDGERTLYLDFYNANPASMADALENFFALTTESSARVLVLGGMEELGIESPAFHRALGVSLRLRAQDRVFLIGTDAEEVRAGFAGTGQSIGSIEVVTTLKPVAEFLANFRGAAFIKGSRKYELERALPDATAKNMQSRGAGSFSEEAGFSSAFSWTRSPVSSPSSWQFPRGSRTTPRSGTFFV